MRARYCCWSCDLKIIENYWKAKKLRDDPLGIEWKGGEMKEGRVPLVLRRRNSVFAVTAIRHGTWPPSLPSRLSFFQFSSSTWNRTTSLHLPLPFLGNQKGYSLREKQWHARENRYLNSTREPSGHEEEKKARASLRDATWERLFEICMPEREISTLANR